MRLICLSFIYQGSPKEIYVLSVSSWDICLTRWYSSPLTELYWSLLCLCSEYIISSRTNHIDQQVHSEWWMSKWWNAISSDVSSYCPRLNSVPASPLPIHLGVWRTQKKKINSLRLKKKSDPWKFRAWRVLILYFEPLAENETQSSLYCHSLKC